LNYKICLKITKGIKLQKVCLTREQSKEKKSGKESFRNKLHLNKKLKVLRVFQKLLKTLMTLLKTLLVKKLLQVCQTIEQKKGRKLGKNINWNKKVNHLQNQKLQMIPKAPNKLKKPKKVISYLLQ
jgi:hypothetical protein